MSDPAGKNEGRTSDGRFARGRVGSQATHPLVGSAGSASLSVPVPSTPSLAGLVLYQQAAVLDSHASNALGWVMSNAATVVVGL